HQPGAGEVAAIDREDFAGRHVVGQAPVCRKRAAVPDHGSHTASVNMAAVTFDRATSPCSAWYTIACMERPERHPPFVAYASFAASVPKLSTVTPAYSFRLSRCTRPVARCRCSAWPPSRARSAAMTPGSLSGLDVCP